MAVGADYGPASQCRVGEASCMRAHSGMSRSLAVYRNLLRTVNKCMHFRNVSKEVPFLIRQELVPIEVFLLTLSFDILQLSRAMNLCSKEPEQK